VDERIVGEKNGGAGGVGSDTARDADAENGTGTTKPEQAEGSDKRQRRTPSHVVGMKKRSVNE